jgi:hypothetical protein
LREDRAAAVERLRSASDALSLLNEGPGGPVEGVEGRTTMNVSKQQAQLSIPTPTKGLTWDLTDDAETAITGALLIAAQEYERDAADQYLPERMRTQFSQQAKTARALIEQIEERGLSFSTADSVLTAANA